MLISVFSLEYKFFISFKTKTIVVYKMVLLVHFAPWNIFGLDVIKIF